MEQDVTKNSFRSFYGNNYHSLDVKNRAFIPNKYKDALAPGFIITKGPDACLFGYTNDAWEDMLVVLADIPLTDAEGRDFVRNFVGFAAECAPDSQGRFNIPQELREYGNLTKEICFVGAIDHFEIWDSVTRKDDSGRYDRNAGIHAEKMQKYLKPSKPSTTA